MKNIFKIISILLVFLVFTRSASLYVFFTSETSLQNKEVVKFVSEQTNSTFLYNDRVKLIDSSQKQNTKLLTTNFDSIKHLIHKTLSKKLVTRCISFVMQSENKPIFKNHCITFPFHNFY